MRKQQYEVLGPLLGIAVGFTAFIILLLLMLYIRYKRKENQKCLTRNEVCEFYKGSKKVKERPRKSVSAMECVSSIEETEYNRTFEVDTQNFRIDDSPLGSGTFGMVWKGIVIKSGSVVEVAAKTLKTNCPSTTLKGFLSEIKVMSYLGHHENLVGMVGAYTKELDSGKVIVFTELCRRGSLESHLRNLDKALICKKESEASEIDLNCLERWCSEIANGMGYLSSKNVVHADLATRNVLLNDQLQAKISDFGLSRRLYDYANYVKNQQEPLPWKWMAPECLKHLEFNEKTDVWAFGVTMWEIYSLGSTPYQGLHWTFDFSTKLINGLRMEQPLYDDGGMYEIMLKCWDVDPSRRPTFSELKADIRSKETKPIQNHLIHNGYENTIDETIRYQNDLLVSN